MPDRPGDLAPRVERVGGAVLQGRPVQQPRLLGDRGVVPRMESPMRSTRVRSSARLVITAATCGIRAIPA
ncbi:hypothetical protein ABZ931_41790, partial [Streptomyces neyagawaensis]